MGIKEDIEIEKDKIGEFIESNKETIAFQCKTCGITMPIGRCGVHRLKTSHAEFEPIYRVKTPKNNNTQELKVDRDKVKLFHF